MQSPTAGRHDHDRRARLDLALGRAEARAEMVCAGLATVLWGRATLGLDTARTAALLASAQADLALIRAAHAVAADPSPDP